jgi:hypothetical protein
MFEKKTIEYIVICSLISAVIWTVCFSIAVWLMGDNEIQQFIAVGLMFMAVFWLHNILPDPPEYGRFDPTLILGVICVVFGPAIGGLGFVLLFR